MAERQGKADDGIQAVQDVSVTQLNNQQMEVNAVASKAKLTPIALLNKIYIKGKGKISKPEYSSIAVRGRQTRQIHEESVWVPELNLRETGYAYNRKEAQDEAARCVLDKLRVAGERKEGLHLVTPEVIQQWYQMIKNFVLTEPQSEAEKEVRFSIGTLKYLQQAEGLPPFAYNIIAESGPDHSKTFTATCTQGGHVTYGTGSSKIDAENEAAYEMYNRLYKQ